MCKNENEVTHPANLPLSSLKLDIRFKTEQLPAKKSLHRIIPHAQSEKRHILIGNRESTMKNESKGWREQRNNGKSGKSEIKMGKWEQKD